MTTTIREHRGLSARRVLALLIGLVPLALLVLSAVVLAPRLGPTMASHWSALDRPNGFSSTWLSFTVIAVITTALSVATVVLLVRVPARGIARLWVGMSVLVSTLVALSWVVTAVASASAPRLDRAELGWGLIVLLAAVPLGVLAFWAVDGVDQPVVPASPVVPVALARGERIAWVGRSGSALFLWLGVVVGVGGLLLLAVFTRVEGDQPVWIAGAVTAVAGLSVLALADVTLSIDGRGLRLVSSLFRIPLFRIPLRDVSGVMVETIDPLRWGGWGLRFSGSGRAYVTGRAEGLVVGRTNGVPTAITIPHATEAASVLEALVRR